MYFGNYTPVVLLSQTDDPAVVASVVGAADRLGLEFVHVHTGLEPFADAGHASTVPERRSADGTSRRRGPEIVTIYWRDIPAQVNGQSGRDRHQVVLSGQVPAGDRPGQAQGADLHRRARHRPVAPRSAPPATAMLSPRPRRGGRPTRMPRTTREYLGRLAYAGGFVADIDDAAIDRAELLGARGTRRRQPHDDTRRKHA